jgi:transglutaminase-like putative cysteine protease/rhodanese-related sulfurtransferase
MTDTSRYPKGKVVEVWLPLAQTDEYQTVSEPKIDAPYAALATLTEDSNGNLMAYIKWGRNIEPSMRVAEVKFTASRYEVGRDDLAEDPNAGFSAEAIAALKEESNFVKVNEEIVKKYAAEAVGDETTTLGKARAVYDWVTTNLARIDNGEWIDDHTFEVEGCGYGDTVQILSDFEKYGIAGGHCTDINSTFVALCRAAGVPAREMFGVRMNDGDGGATGGQHCWAEFYLPGTGWVYADPGDALKAVKPPLTEDKHIDKAAWKTAKASAEFAEKKEYYWGRVDENRVQVSVGRDIVLSPAQKADPRNTFGYPYAEVDGKTMKDDTYRNVDANGKYIDCTKAGEFKYTITCTPATITAEDLMTSLASSTPHKILDLRSAEHYAEGHIVTAVSADVKPFVTGDDKDTAIQNVQKAIENDKEDTKYALICYTGNKYANAGMEILVGLGVNPANIFILAQDDGKQGAAGGMIAWNAKYPSFTGIAFDQVGADDFLVDVRDAGANPAVPGAYSAPAKPNNYAENLDAAYQAADGKRIVIICYTGNNLAKKALLYYNGKDGVDMSKVTYLIGGADNYKDS